MKVLLIVVSLALGLALPQLHAQARDDSTFTDANWVSLGGLPGADVVEQAGGEVLAAVVDTAGNLFIGGVFTMAGDKAVNSVAKWDGSAWSALGSGVILNGARGIVNALAASGTNLFVGGRFDTAGAVSVNHIAKWDGRGWSALGSGVDPMDQVLSLAVSGSILYVGGSLHAAGGITVHGVAKWDGTAWSALGTGVEGNEVLALAVVGTDLYAGGRFNAAGGVPSRHLARWDGVAWRSMGAGTAASPALNDWVLALTAAGTNLYAGGRFGSFGANERIRRVAKWDGSVWTPFGSGVGDPVWPGVGEVNALAVSGKDVYVGGTFKSVFTTSGGAQTVNSIARWNGTGWVAVGSESEDTRVYALALLGTNLYAGGRFQEMGGLGVRNLARWNGKTWSPFGSGILSGVRSLTIWGTNLYAGGTFATAGGIRVNNISKWNGKAWSALGSGLTGGESGVWALAASGTDLYAGGGFTHSGGVQVNRVARWNGRTWSGLGTGIDAGTVYALAVSGTNLYVGGGFGKAGDVAASRIARWNGRTWSPLGAGVDSTVYALAVSGANVYAGGNFRKAGGANADYIAKWDGDTWSHLRSGMSGPVWALAVSGPDLYAGGTFLSAGGVFSASRVARWNGAAWSALGSGLDDTVFSLMVLGQDLYAGGAFGVAGGAVAKGIAKWDGKTWSSLGSGVTTPAGAGTAVVALAASGTDLYAGGGFTIAGGQGSAYVAKALLLGLVTTNATYAREVGSPLKIPLAEIAWDVNSNPVAVQWAGPSEQGATLHWDEAFLYYLPVNNKSDYFAYTVTNGSGSAAGTITVTLRGHIATSITASLGSCRIEFAGSPDFQYDVQRTTTLEPTVNWTTITATPISPRADGSFDFADASAPSSTAYYRTVRR